MVSFTVPFRFINSIRRVKTKAMSSGVSNPPEIIRQYNEKKVVSYSKFIELVDNNMVELAQLIPGSPDIQFVESDGMQGSSRVIVNEDLINRMNKHNVDIQIKSNEQNPLTQIIINILPFVLSFGLLTYLMNATMRGGSGMPNPGNMFGNNYNFEIAQNTGITFQDVAGIDSEQNELAELIQFLKNPERFTNAGAKVPRGCLLSGPPGTGKTLLAKAIAGEAGVPFIACSASQFIELFVGLGASRIRGLFKKARENSPCIIFIDEIDAIGKQRGGAVTASGGGNDEREQTLNQLLTEMDGFEDNNGIIIIGATNRPDVIDPALLRPGRFDRKIEISLPNSEGRERILKVHSKNKTLDSAVNLSTISRITVGCSGAELANIMNEAAILAARENRTCITQNDIDGAYEKITIGLAKKPYLSKEAKSLVAYHESGHAMAGCLVGSNFDDIGKVTILPRGGTGGVTQFIPDSDRIDLGMYTKEYLFNQLVVALGGRAAEEVIFGPDKITTGASGDLKRVTSIATAMVRNYGFSDIGTFEIGDASLTTLDKVDDEVQRIVKEAYTKAKNIMIENKSLLDSIANELIKRETLEGSDIMALVANYMFTMKA